MTCNNGVILKVFSFIIMIIVAAKHSAINIPRFFRTTLGCLAIVH